MGIGTILKDVGAGVGAVAKGVSGNLAPGETVVDAVKKAIKKNKYSSKTSDEMDKSDDMAEPEYYKKGGVVKKTGMAKVHKGERVLTKKQARKMSGRKRA